MPTEALPTPISIPNWLDLTRFWLEVLVLAWGVMKVAGYAERAGRERAVDHLVGWSGSVTPEMRAARHFTEHLNENEAKALATFSTITLVDNQEGRKAAKLALQSLGRSESQMAEYFASEKASHPGTLVLQEEHVIGIRAHLSNFLNLTEAALLAADQGIASKAIIYNEFRFVVTQGAQDLRLCANYRKHMRGDGNAQLEGRSAYPAIDRFVLAIETRQAGEFGLNWADSLRRWFWY